MKTKRLRNESSAFLGPKRYVRYVELLMIFAGGGQYSSMASRLNCLLFALFLCSSSIQISLEIIYILPFLITFFVVNDLI
ncbi:Uncharacterized protein TCM_012008 [Theobroma cacao]|uniref:Uncharacterized protein n=1 Tax=Theobroma cacao TaxID=3641 RepID=A0A061FTH9_THECC|nr:Uncharacterized protein TCM_012008 [Theobroma cacao]